MRLLVPLAGGFITIQPKPFIFLPPTDVFTGPGIWKQSTNLKLAMHYFPMMCSFLAVGVTKRPGKPKITKAQFRNTKWHFWSRPYRHNSLGVSIGQLKWSSFTLAQIRWGNLTQLNFSWKTDRGILYKYCYLGHTSIYLVHVYVDDPSIRKSANPFLGAIAILLATTRPRDEMLLSLYYRLRNFWNVIG